MNKAKSTPSQSNGSVRVHNAHLVADNDLKIKGTLCVGGNLEVHGNLKADRIFCFGMVVVHGDIDVRELVCAAGIDCDGSIVTSSVEVAFAHDDRGEIVLDWLSFAEKVQASMLPRAKAAIGRFVGAGTPIKMDKLARSHAKYDSLVAIKCRDDFKCQFVRVKRNIEVGELFSLSHTFTGSSVSAGELMCEGSLYLEDCLDVSGDVEIRGCLSVGAWIHAENLTARGYVWAMDIVCSGSIDAEGSIDVDESITAAGKILSGGEIAAGGYIKAGGFIASKTRITAGQDYGIFAGLNHPRSAWHDRGYVCAPALPIGVISGIYVSTRSKRPWRLKNRNYPYRA